MKELKEILEAVYGGKCSPRNAEIRISDILAQAEKRGEERGFRKVERLMEEIHERIEDYTDAEYRANYMSEVRLLLIYEDEKQRLKGTEE